MTRRQLKSRRYPLLHVYLGDYYVYPEDENCMFINDEYLVGNLLVTQWLKAVAMKEASTYSRRMMQSWLQ